MVEVTRKNFDILLPEIVQKISKCTFISLDAEYTGIYSEELKLQNTLFDSAMMRYKKSKKVVEKFTLSQFGLAIFQKDRDKNVYYVETYAFYLFPVSFDAFAKRETVTCQVSCINFLARHDFDFNKFMKEGIPFLNNEKADNLRSFLNANPYVMHTSEHLDKDYFPKKFHPLDDDSINEVIDRLAGFSKVIETISKSKKPVVGHNVLNDLLLTHQLFWADLPATYDGFKKSMHDLFPVVYDTKYLAREVQQLRREINIDDSLLSDSNLFTLYTNTYSAFELNMPLVEPRNETRKYNKALMEGRGTSIVNLAESACHNAGFDALVTGCVFLNLTYMACRPEPTPIYRKGLPPTFTELLGKTECWSNRVNIARAIISHINLAGEDPESHRPNWIIVRTFDGKFIDPLKLKLMLVKYGDIEIEKYGGREVRIACGGIGCFKRVWKDLSEQGYILKERVVASDETSLVSSRIKIFIGALGVCGFLTFLIYKRR